jgi:hypothetical protein
MNIPDKDLPTVILALDLLIEISEKNKADAARLLKDLTKSEQREIIPKPSNRMD